MKQPFENDPKMLADVRAAFRPKRFVALLKEAQQVLSRMEVTQMQREFSEIEAKKSATETGSVPWQRLHRRALETQEMINRTADIANNEIKKMFSAPRCIRAIRDDLVDLRRSIEAAKAKKTDPIAKAYREVGLSADAETAVAGIIEPLNRFLSDHVDPLVHQFEARLESPNVIIPGEGHWGVANIAGWVMCGRSPQDVDVS